MKAEDSNIMNIIYSPVMYIHPDKLLRVSPSTDILANVILNHLIIHHYQLEHLPDLWQPDDLISILLLSHWKILPAVAEFIGGYILRERLLIDKMTLISDPKLLAFISLPLRHSVIVKKETYITDYSTWGAEFIYGLTKKFPVALQQRLALCFSSDVLFKNTSIEKTPDNINLLRMAINYAQNTEK